MRLSARLKGDGKLGLGVRRASNLTRGALRVITLLVVHWPLVNLAHPPGVANKPLVSDGGPLWLHLAEMSTA